MGRCGGNGSHVIPTEGGYEVDGNGKYGKKQNRIQNRDSRHPAGVWEKQSLLSSAQPDLGYPAAKPKETQ